MKGYIQEKHTRQYQGCKVSLPYKEDLEHYRTRALGRYGVTSPECLALLDVFLIKEFLWDRLMLARFDAYDVQHPPRFEIQKKLGVSERHIAASKQLVAIHLIALYLMVEKRVELIRVSSLMARILSSGVALEKEELEPPTYVGSVIVVDVVKATTQDEHIQLVGEWSYVA